MVRPPTPPLPAFTISMDPLWMKSKCWDTTLATTLPVTTELPFSSSAAEACSADGPRSYVFFCSTTEATGLRHTCKVVDHVLYTETLHAVLKW